MEVAIEFLGLRLAQKGMTGVGVAHPVGRDLLLEAGVAVQCRESRQVRWQGRPRNFVQNGPVNTLLILFVGSTVIRWGC